MEAVIGVDEFWSWGNPEDYMYAGVDASTIIVLTVGKVPPLNGTLSDPDNLKIT